MACREQIEDGLPHAVFRSDAAHPDMGRHGIRQFDAAVRLSAEGGILFHIVGLPFAEDIRRARLFSFRSLFIKHGRNVRARRSRHAVRRPDTSVLPERTVLRRMPVRGIRRAHFMLSHKRYQVFHRRFRAFAGQRPADEIILAVHDDQAVHRSAPPLCHIPPISFI